MDLTPEKLALFKSSLKQGYGLTKTCQFIFADIKEVSEMVREDESFKELCEECIIFHTAVRLKIGQENLKDLDFSAFMRQNMLMTRYIGTLTLWEDYSTKEKLTRDEFMKAIYLYKYPEEVATACGLTYIEMYDYIKNDEFLSNYLSKVKWIQ